MKLRRRHLDRRRLHIARMDGAPAVQLGAGGSASFAASGDNQRVTMAMDRSTVLYHLALFSFAHIAHLSSRIFFSGRAAHGRAPCRASISRRQSRVDWTIFSHFCWDYAPRRRPATRLPLPRTATPAHVARYAHTGTNRHSAVLAVQQTAWISAARASTPGGICV